MDVQRYATEHAVVLLTIISLLIGGEIENAFWPEIIKNGQIQGFSAVPHDKLKQDEAEPRPTIRARG